MQTYIHYRFDRQPYRIRCVRTKTPSAWGIGGGPIYQQLNSDPAAATTRSLPMLCSAEARPTSVPAMMLGHCQQAVNLFTSPFITSPISKGTVDVGDAIDHSFVYRAGFQFYLAGPWYHSEPAAAPGMSKDGKSMGPAPVAAPAPLPWFSSWIVRGLGRLVQRLSGRRDCWTWSWVSVGMS